MTGVIARSFWGQTEGGRTIYACTRLEKVRVTSPWCDITDITERHWMESFSLFEQFASKIQLHPEGHRENICDKLTHPPTFHVRRMIHAQQFWLCWSKFPFSNDNNRIFACSLYSCVICVGFYRFIIAIAPSKHATIAWQCNVSGSGAYYPVVIRPSYLVQGKLVRTSYIQGQSRPSHSWPGPRLSKPLSSKTTVVRAKVVHDMNFPGNFIQIKLDQVH